MKRAFLTLALASLAAGASAQAQISFLGGANVTRGGEIVTFDKFSSSVFVTNSFNVSGSENHAINIYSLSSGGAFSLTGSVNLNSVFGPSVADILSVSSVAVDPLGRGFGVASIIPTANSSTLGKIVLFDTTSGSILNTLDAGYHPDSVSFTPDGARILVANEGEFVTSGTQTPGSISIVDVSGGAAGLTSSHVTNVDFSTGLASGVSLDGLRNNRLDTLTTKTPDALDVEPEYISSTNDKAFVTLQENNAIAVVDLTGANAGKVTAIHTLGTINQTIDASDRDGVAGTPSTERPTSVPNTTTAAQINDVVAGMPMPDTIVTFNLGGTQVVATANEGDFRLDDADRIRVRDARTGNMTDSNITSAMANNAVLGRLRISTIDGDTNNTGLIDTPTMPGTRSFSIWNPATGDLLFDSGSMIESYVKANDLATFGIESGSLANFDTRSDDKGPEPEALAFGQIEGRNYIFLGAERQNGIFQFDITDINNVSIVGYYNSVTSSADDSYGAFVSPESMQFISAANSPTGTNLLLVGYEGVYDPSASLDIAGSVAVYSVVPEPSTYALLGLGAAALGFAAWRRRQRATA